MRKRKHVRVSIERVEASLGRTRNSVGTRAAVECFHSFFESSQTFKSVSNSIETRKTCFLFLLENSATKKRKQLVDFDYQNVNSLCSRYHYVNCLCCSSVFLSRNFLGLFSKCIIICIAVTNVKFLNSEKIVKIRYFIVSRMKKLPDTVSRVNSSVVP